MVKIYYHKIFCVKNGRDSCLMIERDIYTYAHTCIHLEKNGSEHSTVWVLKIKNLAVIKTF